MLPLHTTKCPIYIFSHDYIYPVCRVVFPFGTSFVGNPILLSKTYEKWVIYYPVNACMYFYQNIESFLSCPVYFCSYCKIQRNVWNMMFLLVIDCIWTWIDRIKRVFFILVNWCDWRSSNRWTIQNVSKACFFSLSSFFSYEL